MLFDEFCKGRLSRGGYATYADKETLGCGDPILVEGGSTRYIERPEEEFTLRAWRLGVLTGAWRLYPCPRMTDLLTRQWKVWTSFDEAEREQEDGGWQSIRRSLIVPDRERSSCLISHVSVNLKGLHLNHAHWHKES